MAAPCRTKSTARRRILYQGIDFPNYHYVKLTMTAGALKGEMFRLDEAGRAEPALSR